MPSPFAETMRPRLASMATVNPLSNTVTVVPDGVLKCIQQALQGVQTASSPGTWTQLYLLWDAWDVTRHVFFVRNGCPAATTAHTLNEFLGCMLESLFAIVVRVSFPSSLSLR